MTTDDPDGHRCAPLTTQERMHTVEMLAMTVMEGAAQTDDDDDLHETTSVYGLYLVNKMSPPLMAAALAMISVRHHRLLTELGLSYE